MIRSVTGKLLLTILFFTAGSVIADAQRIPVPNITMSTLDGGEWSLRDRKGEVVVLNFWATWCEPCRTEVPYLIRLRGELGGKGLSVAGVALDESTDMVRKFVAEYKVDYPVLIPPAGSPWTKLENTPATLIIDREGRLAQKYIGAVPEKELRREVETLLAEPAR